MMSDYNSWIFPLFKDTLLFQIGPLVQKIWCFEVGRPPYFLKILKKSTPISWKPIVQSLKNFRFEVWGLKPICMPNFINF